MSAPMTWFPTFIFYLFAAILVFAALRVVTTRNPVQAALWLVLSFFTAAGIWLMLQAEFLAIALVLVYVGAVMVLFLFVVMMLDVNFDSLRAQFRSYVPIGALVGALVLLEMALVIVGSAIGPGTAAPPAPTGSNTRALGQLLYVDYVYPFEIAAVVLLVAIVAAIALTHRERKTSKYQAPGNQVKVRRKDRVRLVSMPPETTVAKTTQP
ncbi:MAG TPA: NADH-quinone oxidoreductase subunit J [Casimicrobiaceae bacterium]|jgi:NADH-quinone oxidoreductase subunit J|nr:NADH-quinone oxidoreductase subunit J [Casimicrobiaceae bacterium]